MSYKMLKLLSSENILLKNKAVGSGIRECELTKVAFHHYVSLDMALSPCNA